MSHKFSFYSKAIGKSDNYTIEDFEANIHSNDIDNWRRWFANARNKVLSRNDYIIVKMRMPYNKASRTMKVFYKENRKNNYLFSNF